MIFQTCVLDIFFFFPSIDFVQHLLLLLLFAEASSGPTKAWKSKSTSIRIIWARQSDFEKSDLVRFQSD